MRVIIDFIYFVFIVVVVISQVLQLNITWSVNSFAHYFGDKPFDSSIWPTETKFVAFAAAGEGWHNYHHTFPYDYACSELGWWVRLSGRCDHIFSCADHHTSWFICSRYLNPTKLFIDFCWLIGLAYDCKQVWGLHRQHHLIQITFNYNIINGWNQWWNLSFEGYSRVNGQREAPKWRRNKEACQLWTLSAATGRQRETLSRVSRYTARPDTGHSDRLLYSIRYIFCTHYAAFGGRVIFLLYTSLVYMPRSTRRWWYSRSFE